MRSIFEIFSGFLIGVLLGLISYIFFKNMYASIAFGVITDAVVLALFDKYKKKQK